MGLVSPCSCRSPRPCIMMAVFNISDFIILQVAPPSLTYLPVLKRFLELQECVWPVFPSLTSPPPLRFYGSFWSQSDPGPGLRMGTCAPPSSWCYDIFMTSWGHSVGRSHVPGKPGHCRPSLHVPWSLVPPLSPSTSPPSLLGRLFWTLPLPGDTQGPASQRHSQGGVLLTTLLFQALVCPAWSIPALPWREAARMLWAAVSALNSSCTSPRPPCRT